MASSSVRCLGFCDPEHFNYVCLLKSSLYGLEREPRAWYQRFIEFAATLGFSHSVYDHSLFIYHDEDDTTYILIYVDNIISLHHLTLLANLYCLN